MIFLMLPLAFALSFALIYLPNTGDYVARALRAFFAGVKKWLQKTAGEESARLYPLLSLLFLAALLCILGGLLEAVHPLLSALLVVPVIVLPDLIRDALDVREALEEGECTSDEQRRAYEQRVIASIGTLAQESAHRLVPLALIGALTAPFHLAPAAVWTLYALHLLAQDGCAACKKADDFLSRLGEAALILAILPTAALCGTEMGMAARARKHGAANVLLSAVGVDPQLQGGHRPVTGDISQSCLCVCIALALCYAIIALPMQLILTRFLL